jgi:hypothetical protein
MNRETEGLINLIMEGSIGKLLLKVFNEEDRARMWLRNGNINFGGAVPLDLINAGRAEKVIEFIQAAINGY